MTIGTGTDLSAPDDRCDRSPIRLQARVHGAWTGRTPRSAKKADAQTCDATLRWTDVLATPPSSDPQHRLLDGLLGGTACISLLALILSPALGWQTAPGRVLCLSSLVLLAGTAVAIVINRRSSFLAGALFVLLLTALLVGAGAGARGLVIPVLLAGILLRPWASLATAGLGGLATATIWLCRPGYTPEIPSLFILLAVALVAWLATRSLAQALHDRRQSELRLVESEKRFRQMEERLRQAQKMEAMGRLAAGVAHDFNNYLTVIGSYVDLLLLDLEPGAPQRQELAEIAGAVEQSKSLVCQLLAFSRQQVLHPQVLNVNEVIARAEGILRRLAGKDVQVVVECDSALGLVRADPGQIEQVLLNLVTNARDAVSGPGTIIIRTANIDAGVTISVSDTGTGIDAATLQHIFEPFFTTKENERGVGLGLSTVYGIVHQSGGQVEVESEPGRGTTFTIYLPRVADK